jgi:hypothetical protein
VKVTIPEVHLATAVRPAEPIGNFALPTPPLILIVTLLARVVTVAPRVRVADAVTWLTVVA